MSKVIKFIKNNKLIIVLTLLTFVIWGYSLFALGIDKSFFSGLDPDVVYITNALLYTKYAIISYMDHPGTPTIVLLYYLFFPLRLMAKYIFHQNFIQWSFDNYAFLTYYTRIFELSLSTVAFFIYLKVIKKISNSNWIMVFAGLCTFLFASIMATRIVPENLSFFLTAVWLVVFVKFAKTRKYLWNVILICISGIAFANKFTSVFLLVISVLLPFFIRRVKLGWKVVMLEANMTVSFQTFLFGIWPIRYRLAGIIDWGRSLFNHADIHGTGAASVFDWSTYLSSASLLIKGYPATFVFICLTILLGIYLLIKKKLRINDPIIFLTLGSVVGILVFAKYPLIYYNSVNILLLIFCSAYFLSKLRITVTKFLLPVVILVFLMTTGRSIFAVTQFKVEPTENVYGVLRVWSSWSDNIFIDQLEAVKKP